MRILFILICLCGTINSIGQQTKSNRKVGLILSDADKINLKSEGIDLFKNDLNDQDLAYNIKGFLFYEEKARSNKILKNACIAGCAFGLGGTLLSLLQTNQNKTARNTTIGLGVISSVALTVTVSKGRKTRKKRNQYIQLAKNQYDLLYSK